MEPRRQNRSIKNYCIALAVLRPLTDRSRNESDIGLPTVDFCKFFVLDLQKHPTTQINVCQ
jgi:hypothetical protein